MVLFATAPVYGQGPVSGSVSGTVTLPDGGPAAGATIIIVSARREVRADEHGEFRINLPPGSYEGFAQRDHLGTPRRRLVVRAGETTAVEFVLDVAAYHEPDVSPAEDEGEEEGGEAEHLFGAFSASTSPWWGGSMGVSTREGACSCRRPGAHAPR